MHCIEPNLGVSTADADQIQLQFVKGDLSLTFLDWQEHQRKLVFQDVIAFKWQELDLSEFDIRDDTTYEVIDSVWLLRQSRRPLERKQMQPAKY
ncbi:MAG: hypothetical protein IPJ49_15660 [Candidatus Obscuribacter sp.]|jgi:hypothetical protein|nr:hypothetical protein [Candidatus Obscuribacter sp.]